MIRNVLLFLFVVFVVHKICVWTAPFGSLLDGIHFSKEITDRDAKLLRLTLSKDDTYRIKTNLGEISPLSKKATLLYEDRYFYWHPG